MIWHFETTSSFNVGNGYIRSKPLTSVNENKQFTKHGKIIKSKNVTQLIVVG
jgi:hypothetical protein